MAQTQVFRNPDPPLGCLSTAGFLSFPKQSKGLPIEVFLKQKDLMLISVRVCQAWVLVRRMSATGVKQDLAFERKRNSRSKA